VTPTDRAAAQAALSEGRVVYGRLDQIRGPEDAAADIMDLWSASESAMRAMLGGSTLSGQALVRELRQRGTLNLEQANSLASFWDARSRADDVAYKPTLTDVGFARAGYNELTRAVNEMPATASAGVASTAPTSTFAPGGAPSGQPAAPAAAAATAAPIAPGSAELARPPRSQRVSPPIAIAIGVVALIIIAAVAAYLTFGKSRQFNGEMENAINLMQTGRTEAARAAFGAVAHEYPDRAEPHVFLSRLARSDTPPDMNTARQELVTAIRLNPAYEPAQREMGIFELADHNPSLARNFLIRAVQLAPADSAAQGYLGCALMGLNRVDDAQKFLGRAGTGTWSSCVKIQPAPTTP
jgi:hypothetical protein